MTNKKSAVPKLGAASTTKRRVLVPGHGIYRVPEHVSRVDSGRGGKGWHGWQVRWPGHSKWFSDARHGSCRAAFREAVAYAAQAFPGKRSQIKTDKGVHVVSIAKRGRNALQIYVVASHPQYGRSARRIYVGTSNTVTDARIRRAMAEAVRIRKSMITEHRLATGTVLRKNDRRGSSK